MSFSDNARPLQSDGNKETRHRNLCDISSCAIVGLGLIGATWATHLETDGVLRATWNRSPKDFPHFESSLARIPSQANLIHIVVSDEKALLSVVSTLAPHLSSQHIVIQSTTIDPRSSAEALTLVHNSGAQYLEAPFTGSLPGALSRKTLFYLGGDAQLITTVTPYLKRLSETQIVIGSHAQACTLKLAMNLQIASAVAALCESISICRNADIPDTVFFAALASNAAASALTRLKEPLLLSGQFPAQFATQHMAKDMRLLSAHLGKEFPLHAGVLEKLQAAMDAGLGAEDFAAMVKLHQKS